MGKSKHGKRQPISKRRNLSKPSAVIIVTLVFGVGLFLFQQYRLQVQKQALIDEMRSSNNGIALAAVREMMDLGWLEDGTLRGADLHGANLEGVELWSADLRGADLGEANLQGAELVQAKLMDANLAGANLQDARLWTANLQGANLQGADLREAEWIEANLTGVNLTYAIFDEETPLPDSVYVGDADDGSFVFDVYWMPDTDMTRYTDPNHPDYWQPEWMIDINRTE